MTADQRKHLSGYVNALRRLLPIFEVVEPNIEGSPVEALAEMMGNVQADLPGLAPSFIRANYFSYTAFDNGATYYRSAGVRAYISMALSMLESHLDADASDGTPVTEHREFKFLHDPALRAVVERDYAEIQRSFIARCNKSVIILAGGAIEAVLLDQLQANKAKSLGSAKAPSGERDLTRWGLADLINVAVDLRVVSNGVDTMSHAIRGYRNLVHPGVEIRTGMKFGVEEAKIAIEVLHIIHRDLS